MTANERIEAIREAREWAEHYSGCYAGKNAEESHLQLGTWLLAVLEEIDSLTEEIDM